MNVTHAVLLVGSAKPAGTSTSEALGRYLLEHLQQHGVTASIMTVERSAVRYDPRPMLQALAAADLFILATPLYVDSFPYLVTRAFESIAAARSRDAAPRPCAFVTVVNCGFPESRQCETALAIARAFAKRARLAWAGGLALGEGAAIDGRPLEKVGALTRHVRAALDQAAAALAAGHPVPADAIAKMARPLMPAHLYTFVSGLGWRRQARRHGAGGRLAAHPYD